MSWPVQKPAMVGRSGVVVEVSACSGYFGGRLEPFRIVFEDQQAVAENAEVGKSVAHVVLHRAEVFADNHRLIANAFEREDAHQILRRGL